MIPAPDPRQMMDFADLAGVGVFQVDAERNVVAVSDDVERITGFQRDEVLGRSCLSLVRCPECLKGCGVFQQGVVKDARLTLYRKDGTEVEVVKSGTVLTDEAGVVVGAVETLRLAAELAGDACRGMPPELDAILKGLGRMFVAADDELRIAALSPGLAELVGRRVQDLVGEPLEALFGPELFGRDGGLARAVSRGERQEGWRGDLRRVDGLSVPVSLSVGPLPQDHGCCRRDVAAVVMLRVEERRAPEVPRHVFQGILARSPAMQQIFRLVELLRGHDAAVLISGESGTGKELVARAIHRTSHRGERPFVAVNCAAIPSELMESELFGHARGAFTGAVRDRPGRFEAADGGTLFLDEIGDLPLELQGKLLRAIQQRTFERVGENRTRAVDVRVLAATNKDLSRAVAEGDFREDLYYRLRVIPIQVPPLRKRREDIPLLLQHFLEQVGQRHGRALRLSPDASRALLAHGWPGNVRELENVVEYAVTVCEGQTIHMRDLPQEVRGGEAARSGLEDPMAGRQAAPRPDPSDSVASHSTWTEGSERALSHLSPAERMEAGRILDALAEARFRRSRAAELLGMSRTTLWRRMREYRL